MFNGWEVASYGWAKKVVSWDGNHSWWRCCENRWNDNKEYRLLHKLVDKVGEGLERITLILREVLLWVKCYQTAFLPQRNRSWKEGSIDTVNLTVALF